MLDIPDSNDPVGWAALFKTPGSYSKATTVRASLDSTDDDFIFKFTWRRDVDGYHGDQDTPWWVTGIPQSDVDVSWPLAAEARLVVSDADNPAEAAA